MTIGSFGDVVFRVSDTVVNTINNLQWSGSANWSTHERHGTTGIIEYTGANPEELSFDMVLSAYLGKSPSADLDRIRDYTRCGAAKTLVLGSKVIGRGKWVITSWSSKADYYASNGAIAQYSVSVSLREYLKSY